MRLSLLEIFPKKTYYYWFINKSQHLKINVKKSCCWREKWILVIAHRDIWVVQNWDVNKRTVEKKRKKNTMFAPNVWSFDPPNTQFIHKYSESNPKHAKQICKRIHSHPFNRLVSFWHAYKILLIHGLMPRKFCLHWKCIRCVFSSKIN